MNDKLHLATALAVSRAERSLGSLLLALDPDLKENHIGKGPLREASGSLPARTGVSQVISRQLGTSAPYPLLFSREMFLKRPDDIPEFAAGE